MHVELCWSLLGRARAEPVSEGDVCWVQELSVPVRKYKPDPRSYFSINLKVAIGKKSSFAVLAQLGSCCFPEVSRGQHVPVPGKAVGLVSRNIGFS